MIDHADVTATAWRDGQLVGLARAIAAGMACFLLLRSMPGYYGAFFLFGLGAGMLMPGFMAGISLAVRSDQQGSAADSSRRCRELPRS